MAFTFKRFHVEDELCPMKVGTDAILLGAWADITGAEKILDIGTGCGIIALMLAQRAPMAVIDAIDIDAMAARQAALNFSASDWQKRLNPRHISLKEFASGSPASYDLVVSNPPYFISSLRSPSPERNVARHDETLDLAVLMHHSSRLVNAAGKCCFIIPSDAEITLSNQGILNNLHLSAVTRIIPKNGKRPNRSLMEFCWKRPRAVSRGHITILDANGQYTEEFKMLTGDFYLRF